MLAPPSAPLKRAALATLRSFATIARLPLPSTTATPPSPFRVHACLLGVSLLFGANYVFTKLVIAEVAPRSWVLFRIAGAAVVFALMALRWGKGRPTPRGFLLLALAAVLGIVLNQLLFTLGMQYTTATHSAVINACIPTWTLVLAALFGQERLTPPKLLAVAIALAGIGTLFRVDELLTGHDHLSSEQLLGDLLTWANGVSFALHLILMRRIGTQYDARVSTAVMFGSAALLALAFCGPGVTAQDLAAVTTAPVCWYALYGVLFATVLTYFINTWALRWARSSQVALYINVQPLVAAAMGPWFALPAPDWRFYVALSAVALGLVLQTRAR